MFFVWGKQLVYRRLGHVADFCPMCRKARSFDLQRVGLAGHISFVSLGQGDLVGHQRACRTCKTTLNADPRTYRSICPKPAPLADLRRLTFPGLADAWAERLRLERQIRLDPTHLAPKERRTLVRDPFLLLSPAVQRRFASIPIDQEVALACATAVFLMIIGAAMGPHVVPNHPELALLLGAAPGIALVASQLATARQRYLRREVVPSLARALAPLRPTTTELSAVLGELRQAGHKLGATLPLPMLEAEIHSR